MLRRALLGLLALNLWGCDPGRGVPVFLFHSVGEGNPDDVLDVTPAEFDAELSLIEAAGATPITLAQLLDARDGKGKLPAKPVVLTFDDGRACLYSQAQPLLLKHHMVAETFIITGFLGDDPESRHVDPGPNGPHPYLTWTELHDMAASGAWVIESHSVSHQDMAKQDGDRQREELHLSRAQLQARMGVPVDFFAYPFGAFDTQSRDLAQAEGYRAALTVQKGLGSRFAMRRQSIHKGGVGFFAKVLHDAYGAPAGSEGPSGPPPGAPPKPR